MRSSYDLSRANALIDAYLVAIRDTAQIAGKHGRTWLEFMMKEHGVIPDVRPTSPLERPKQFGLPHLSRRSASTKFPERRLLTIMQVMAGQPHAPYAEF